MFPIPWNFPFRKKDGSLVKINDVLNGGGGGGYTLPTASTDVKGGVKIGAGLTMDGEVLKNTNPTPPTPYTLPTASAQTLGGVKIGSGVNIDENGVISVSGGGGGSVDYGIYSSLVSVGPRPVFRPDSSDLTKYGFTVATSAVSQTTGQLQFSSYIYSINDVYLPDAFSISEMSYPITEAFLTGVGAVLLCEQVSEASTSIELLHSLSDYKTLILQGCYDNSGSNSNYDTTIIYERIALNSPYWFGVRDRNTNYSGSVNFTDNTHGTLSANRRVKVYGIPK